MNLSLTPELERWIAAKVAGGQYRNASEVVREGLRLLQERETAHQTQLSALRGEIQAGLHELECGDGVEGEAAFDRILDRIARAEESAA